jgi:DNA (cytosine-5)-methyltransferase 1
LLNAADCGVPQKRERVFFCAVRNDIDVPPLKLAPTHRWVSAGEATSDVQEITESERAETAPTGTDHRFYNETRPGDSYDVACMRLHGKRSFFNHVRLHKDRPSPTLTATHSSLNHWTQCRRLTLREWKRLGSFPDDYHAKTDKIGKYMIGMSVPPKMTEQVARAVCEQWLNVNYSELSNDNQAKNTN